MQIISFSLLFLVLQVFAKLYTLKENALWPNAEHVQALKRKLTGSLTMDTDADFKPPFTYNLRTGPPRPAFVVEPANDQDIITVVGFAHRHGIRITVRSTGSHSDVRNTADQSILIDMARFNQKSINMTEKSITVGPGQTFSDIYKYVYAETGGSLVVNGPSVHSVGPAGWALGGGHGRLTRIYGLGADSLLSVSLITANGTKLIASETNHRELFRALRGAGHSFGIVTALKLQLYSDPGNAYVFDGAYLLSANIAKQFQSWFKTSPNNIHAYFITGYEYSVDVKYAAIHAMCFGVGTICKTALQRLTNLPDCYGTCKEIRFYPSYSFYLKENWDVNTYQSGVFASTMASSALDFSDENQLAKIVELQASFKQHEWKAYLTCYVNCVLGGSSVLMDKDQTKTSVAKAMRNSLAVATCAVVWDDYKKARPDIVQMLDNWAESSLKQLSTNKWVYWNEPQHNFPSNDWQARYYGGTKAYAKLRAVKDRYDPAQVFSCYHCVGWEEISNVDPSTCPDNCSCSNMLTEGVCAAKIGASSKTTLSLLLNILIVLALVL